MRWAWKGSPPSSSLELAKLDEETHALIPGEPAARRPLRWNCVMANAAIPTHASRRREVSIDGYIDDVESAARFALAKAGAIDACPVHRDMTIRVGDEEAERHAYSGNDPA